MTNEEVLWTGTPSQVVNIKAFILCGLLVCVASPLFIVWWNSLVEKSTAYQIILWSGLLFLLVIPLLVMFWKWLVTKCTVYEVTNQRLRMKWGVLNKQTEDLELYRVKDFRVDQPLLLRIFSAGDILLETSDRTQTSTTLRAIKQPEALKDLIRNQVEILREVKHVREID